MRAIEFLSEDDTPRIKLSGDKSKAKAWIQKVYDLYPGTFQNNHVMSWGEGDDQQFAMFELVPSMARPNAVEVKWFQAYPLRQGVGSRAMQELQRLAKEDGIGLTLFPWDKGQVSQAKLMKFYKGQGFQPNKPGSKNMYWSPEVDEAINPDITSKKFTHAQQIGDYLYKASVEIFMDDPLLNIKAYDGNKEIGHAMFEILDWENPEEGWLESGGTEVLPKYRGKNIAYTMYAYAKMLGNSIQASYNQTAMGKKMWQGWGNDAKNLGEAELDPRGWGAVPQSIDVDYFGLQVQMRPSMFLKLARPLDDAGVNPEVAQHMEKGGKIAYPWLDIAEPVEWEQGDFSKDAKVRQHEGRNRMHKWIKMKGDDPIQVNIFFKNANRRKYITPEMILKLSQGVFNETGQWVNGPLFDPKTAQ